MPAGLQTINEDGSIQADYTTRMGGLVARITTTAVHGGSVAVPGMPTGEFFYFIVPAASTEARQPSLVYQDGRVYWYADLTGGGQPAYPLVPVVAFVGWC